jgi:hypothetical protein
MNTEGTVYNAMGRINRLSVLCIDAYGVAVKNGFKGTVEEWLASLKGEDYVLTEADKAEIAEMAAAMVDVPDSGGNVDLTGYATEKFVRDGYQPKGDYAPRSELPKALYVLFDVNTQTADKTMAEIEAAYNAGSVIIGVFQAWSYTACVTFMTYGEFTDGIGVALFVGWNSETVKQQCMFMVTDDGEGIRMELVDGGNFATVDDIPKTLPNPSVLTINGTTYDGSEPVSITLEAPDIDTEEVKALVDSKMLSVKSFGAKGDGVTDDSDAFIAALANKQSVAFVPGGTYKLSKTIVITENSCLELSQNTLLDFTQTSGNCIEMRGSATLRGNHGNINVSGSFTGNVISVDTALDGVVHGNILPYGNWTPLWQRQRFIHDVNITRTEGGFRGSLTGGHSGTALYVSANYGTKEDYNGSSTAPITVIWGMSVTGLRIGGAFDYGINIENMDKTDSGHDNQNDPAWNHDMRIEAVIVGCETGVRVFNCNTAHLDVTIEPAPSINKVNGEYVKYAKNGIILEHSNHIDLSQSLVWDWNTNGTLVNKDAKNAHIALIGVCKGVIVSDFLYHEHSGTDIRKLIYTDTPSNFDSLIILQEPFTRWFKPIDGVPYFFDGTGNRALMLRSDKFTAEQAEFIHDADGYYESIPNYTNVVTDYENGYYINSSGTTSALAGMVTTGFIPLDGKAAHTFRVGGTGIRWKTDLYADTNYCRMAFYDADKNLVDYVMPVGSMLGNDDNPNSSYPHFIEDDTVDSAIVTSSLTAGINHGAAYFRISAVGKGANLIITIDEKVEDKAIWHGEPRRLDESIHAVTDWNAAEGEVGYIKNKPASIGGTSAPADWNASEGEVGYIENRTHYKKVVTMLKNAVCASDGDVYTLPECGSLVVGNTYDITIDGTTYSLKAFELDGVPAIGSVEYFETFDPTLPIPLCFTEDETGIFGMYGDMTAESITVTLKVHGYETIPAVYLPKQYHIIPVSSDAWVKTDGAYNITDYDIRDLYSAYKAGYPVYIDIDYGEHGTKRIQITGYCFNLTDSTIQLGFEQNHYAIPVFLAGVCHNGLAAEIVTVRINVTD